MKNNNNKSKTNRPKVANRPNRYKAAMTNKPRHAQPVESMTIKHSELIYTQNGVAVSDPLRLMNFNPGNLKWLAGFASRFEVYEVISAKVRWVSSSATTLSGTVTLRLDYDVLDSAPASAEEMYNGGNVASCKPWADLSLPVKAPWITPRRKYTSNGFSPQGSDAKMYDAFSVWLNSPSNVYGNIFIDYTVKFSIPQLAGVPSGSVDAPSATNFTNYAGSEHGLNPEKPPTVAGPLPGILRTPLAKEVAGGMVSGVLGVELTPNFQGMVNIAVDSLAADATQTIDWRSMNTNITNMPLNDMFVAGNTGVASAIKVDAAAQDAFIQPFWVGASSPVALEMDIASARYDFL